MWQNNTRRIALSGMLAAVAVVIMCLGGIIPIATYICPMLCCLTQFVVLRFCGKKLSWTWYMVVSFLSLLMGPDKEAAIVFAALGSYPMLKPVFSRFRLGVLIKLLFFNISISAAYGILIYLMGMHEIAAENTELGAVGLAIILLLGNITFLLLDKLLTMLESRLR